MSQEQEIIDNDISELSPKTKFSRSSGKNRILNDSSVFYKGLFGMILCIVPAAIIGLVLIKISLEQAKVALTEYRKDPDHYRISSIKMIKRGRTFAYIGLALFILELIALVAYMSLN
ncbi:MAG: hypothetical protein QNK23_08810 [Crocinitomicaceae bacterium]|nr:hypothetical protein [Crocinitomicaceae bacterium]